MNDNEPKKKTVMGRPVGYETQIKKCLKAAGIYDAKLDLQIKICARSLSLLDKLAGELDSMPLFAETYKKGEVARELNPLVMVVQKQNTLVTEQLTSLGLNFRAKASNVKESVGGADDGLSDLIRRMSGDE